MTQAERIPTLTGPETVQALRRWKRGRNPTELLTWQGIRLDIAAWSSLLSITPQAIRRRLEKGWTVDKALGTPISEAHKSRLRYFETVIHLFQQRQIESQQA
jgi:hypothetical protein